MPGPIIVETGGATYVPPLEVTAGSISNYDTNEIIAPTGTSVSGGSAPYTYEWTLIGKPAASDKTSADIVDATSIDFTSFQTDVGGIYVFQLKVVDNDGTEGYGHAVSTIGRNGWIRQDLSLWVKTEGSVAGLITSVSSTEVVFADLTANSSIAEWTYFTGPLVQANKRYEFKYIRVNPEGYDRAGLCIGVRDSADGSPKFCAGQFETAAVQNHFGALEAATWENTHTGCIGSIITFVSDKNANCYGGVAIAINSAGERLGRYEQGSSIYTATTPVITVYGRHGITGHGSPSTVRYEIWLRISPLETT